MQILSKNLIYFNLLYEFVTSFVMFSKLLGCVT